jgi:hypothetical protein
MFYTFCQNNSFGVDYGPAKYVIVEAASAEEANQRAIEVEGVYFDGVASGIDCPCCGNRWSREYYDSGEETPMIRGQEPEEARVEYGWTHENIPFYMVYPY